MSVITDDLITHGNHNPKDRFQIAKRGPFIMEPIPPPHDNAWVPLSTARWRILDGKGKFVAAGLPKSIETCFDNLQLLYAEWLMVKRDVPRCIIESKGIRCTNDAVHGTARCTFHAQ